MSQYHTHTHTHYHVVSLDRMVHLKSLRYAKSDAVHCAMNDLKEAAHVNRKQPQEV